MKFFCSAALAAIFVCFGFNASAQSTPANPLANTQAPKLSFNRSAPSGPFGFVPGMTKDQIIERVGKENVAEIEKDKLGGVTIILRTAPKPYAAFSDYAVDVSPTRGLLRVMAFGTPVSTSEDGTELKRAFSSVKAQLLTNYGIPTDDQDFVKSGSIWREPRDFMMGLIKKDRTLASYWRSDDQPFNGSIVTIILRGGAQDTSTGTITLSYAFAGWREYYEQLTSAEGAVL